MKYGISYWAKTQGGKDMGGGYAHVEAVDALAAVASLVSEKLVVFEAPRGHLVINAVDILDAENHILSSLDPESVTAGIKGAVTEE